MESCPKSTNGHPRLSTAGVHIPCWVMRSPMPRCTTPVSHQIPIASSTNNNKPDIFWQPLSKANNNNVVFLDNFVQQRFDISHNNIIIIHDISILPCIHSSVFIYKYLFNLILIPEIYIEIQKTVFWTERYYYILAKFLTLFFAVIHSPTIGRLDDELVFF